MKTRLRAALSAFFATAAALALVAALAIAPARATNLSLDGNLSGLCGTATASAGAATLANRCGVITSEALTTAQNAIYTLTITDTAVAAADLCFVSTMNGTNTQGTPMVGTVTSAANSLVALVINKHASAEALNGTILVKYFCFKP